MKPYLKLSLYLFLLTSMAACSPNKADSSDTTNDSAAMETDTTLLDTPMSTGTGTDTIQQKLKEGEDGTGKASTDPRTRKQQ